MSLYLGRNKVGVVYKDDNPNVIDNETLEELNDAVGYRVGDFDNRNIPQMIENLKKDFFQSRKYDIMPDYHIESWVRPQEWPDLDSLNLQMEGDDFIYMTYKNTDGRAAIAWHIEKISGGKDITVTMGHIENGVYVVDETITNSSNNYVRWLTDNDPDYIVVRITGDIYRCYSYAVSANGATQHMRKQPVVERIAWVPHLQYFCSSSSQAWGQFMTQREKVANGDGTALTSLYYAWAYCRDLENLDISGIHTPNVTNMNASFIQCLKLRELDLKHFNVDKVTTFNSLFLNCRNLKSVDLTGWNTIAVTNLASMFDSCFSLTEIKGIENFITSKVTTLSATFSNCRSITSLNLTEWNTEKVTTFYLLFNGCYSLLELDLSTWDVSKVTNMSTTFSNCYSLKRINFDNWITGILTTIYSIFSNCWSLQELDLSWLNITSACTDICYAFSSCYSLKEINLPVWDVTGIVAASGNRSHSIFNACWSVEKITGITNWQFRHNLSSANMFSNCYNLREVDVSGWNISGSTTLASCFQNCHCLKELDLSDWNPINSTNLSSMFSGCYSLTTLGDISNWDTSNVTTMANMFRYCYSLEEFPSINDWDLSNVTSLDSIFSECTSLEEIVWNNVNIPNCTNVHQLFRSNYNLKKIETKNWTLASNITYSASYYQIYGDCWQLRDIEGVIIPSTYTQLGFANCENLSHESLLTILNALPQTTAGHTIHITTAIVNLLTPEEKTIATNKNWTIAN